jgi:hypothetical protein
MVVHGARLTPRSPATPSAHRRSFSYPWGCTGHVKRLLVFAFLAGACAAPPTTGPETLSTTPAVSPSAMVAGWPTVGRARAALTAAGYQLFRDITDDNQVRWTGQDPRTAPIEILGEDTAPAKLAISGVPMAGTGRDLDAVLALFPQPDREKVIGLLAPTREAAASAGPFDGVERTVALSNGLARTSWFSEQGTIVVFLEPGSGAYPVAS